MAHFWSLCEGIAPDSPAGPTGRRNGRAPVGDAWLLDGVISKSIPTNFRYACGAKSRSVQLFRGSFPRHAIANVPATSDIVD